MGPEVHAGATAALLLGANLAGYNVGLEIIAATTLGGFLIDGDKVFEIADNKLRAKMGKIPDITARWRVLHSILAWPFGWILSFYVGSWLPFIAIFLHALADSAIPGLEKDGKNYPSHPPLKWIMPPFFKKWWYQIVPIGWPVTYPSKLNRVYTRLAPAISAMIALFLIIIWLIR